jgi:hypothetical protein
VQRREGQVLREGAGDLRGKPYHAFFGSEFQHTPMRECTTTTTTTTTSSSSSSSSSSKCTTTAERLLLYLGIIHFYYRRDAERDGYIVIQRMLCIHAMVRFGTFGTEEREERTQSQPNRRRGRTQSQPNRR